jgi:hypothetical protein
MNVTVFNDDDDADDACDPPGSEQPPRGMTKTRALRNAMDAMMRERKRAAKRAESVNPGMGPSGLVRF